MVDGITTYAVLAEMPGNVIVSTRMLTKSVYYYYIKIALGFSTFQYW